MKILSLFFVLLVSFSVTKADNAVFTSGTAIATGVSGLARFSFNASGPGSSMFGATNSLTAGTVPCFCQGGQTTTLSAGTNLMLPSDWSGSLVHNGTVYSSAQGQSFITFSTPSIVIPMTGDSTLAITSPFSMAGNLFIPSQSLSVGFGGSGMATMNLRLTNPNTYALVNVTYTFAAPMPEPVTIILLSSGVLGLALRKRISG